MQLRSKGSLLEREPGNEVVQDVDKNNRKEPNILLLLVKGCRIASFFFLSQTITNIFNTFFSRENPTKIAIYPDLRAATFSVAMANRNKLTTKLAPI